MPMDMIMKQPSDAKNKFTDAAKGTEPSGDEQILTESGFEWRERGGVKVLVCRELANHGFINGFSTRLGGVSAFPANDLNLAGFNEDLAENIYENRCRFVRVFGDDLALATVWQMHGDDIKDIQSREQIEESEDKADAMTCGLASVLIGVKTADCVPVLIGDPATGAFASIHAGWRGTVQSIVKKTIAQLIKNYGSEPEKLICAIGPAASGKNYEIGQDVMDAFAINFPESEKYFTATRGGHALVDLHLANRDQLLACGVSGKNIYTAPFCTMERPDLFFSYRLEKKRYGKTGRLLSVIGRAAS